MLRKICPYLLIAAGAFAAEPLKEVDWPFFGGDQAGSKYSALTQINRDNVGKLKVAWQWHTGESALAEYKTTPGVFEVTPLMVDGTLYLSTPYNRVIALDPATGKPKWSYDPKAYQDGQVPNGTGFVHRGVAFWRDGSNHRGRIVMNSRAKLIELDTETGKPVAGFGDNGVVDLLQGLAWQVDPKQYTNTSPPIVYGDLIILGNGVADRITFKKDPPGDVRAFQARTGKLVWTFHTVPRKGEFGSDT